VHSWIVVADDPAVDNLIATARSAADEVTVVVVGARSVAQCVATAGVDKVVWFDPAGAPPEAYAGVVADLVAAAAPDLVLGAKRSADRVLLGAAAAKLNAPAYGDAVSVRAGEDGLIVEREVFGGIAEETDAVTGPLALVLAGGNVPAPAAPAAAIEERSAQPYAVTITARAQPSAAEHVDLGAAARVVACGRGVKAEKDLALIEGLADALKAELACSRPLAEGQSWMPKSRYIGISGQQVAPQLYIAIGISGQLQHMAGVRGAGTIVAINNDQAAPIFDSADYALLGDLYVLVPALIEALAAS
jgi:electron transfer flavoprotein alpha subunit